MLQSCLFASTACWGLIWLVCQFVYLFGVLHRFQHCTGHITTGSWKGRGNQYIQFVRVLYCKLPTNGKQLPAFPLETVLGTEPRPQRWEVTVLPLCQCGPYSAFIDTTPGNINIIIFFFFIPWLPYYRYHKHNVNMLLFIPRSHHSMLESQANLPSVLVHFAEYWGMIHSVRSSGISSHELY